MSHRCHADGCNLNVPPRMFMCRRHWFMLPPDIRGNVWRTYREGQEIDKNPSEEYLKVTRNAINWLTKKEGRR